MRERVFANGTEFALFLERCVAFEAFADNAGRAAFATVIAHEARERIGHAKLLPPPLAEATQVERVRAGFSADETLLRSGALRDSIHWAHESARTTIVGSDSPIALYQELGTPHIPGRAFLVPTLQEHGEPAFEAFCVAFRALFDPR